MSRHKLKDSVVKVKLPSSLCDSYHSKTTFPGLCFCRHFTLAFTVWLQRNHYIAFSASFSPCPASLPHFCPSLLSPFILRDSGQGSLQFPLLMASPCYCGQTSAVSMLVPGSGTYFSFPKQQAKLMRTN